MTRGFTSEDRNRTAEALGGQASLNVLGIFILRRLDEVSHGSEFEWVACNFHAFEGLGMPREVVRGILRAMAEKGLVACERGLWDEEGRPAGSGYRILAKGREIVREWPERGWLDA